MNEWRSSFLKRADAGPSPLTVDLSGVGFGQKPSYSVCGDGKRDSRRHFESVDADDVSVLSETGSAAMINGFASRTNKLVCLAERTAQLAVR